MSIKELIMSLRILAAALLLILGVINARGKEWRGIVPLKSTRADVERLFGKENELGRYQFEDERAYIFYSDGPCGGVYQGLKKDKCECLVPDGTVLSIHVTLEVSRKFSSLKIDSRLYERQLIRPGTPIYAYSNSTEGVVYRVDESADDIIAVEYLPSAKTCQDVKNAHAKPRNVWRDLSPLHSTRSDVERLLGPPKTKSPSALIYKIETEAVTVRYARGNCNLDDSGWSVPLDTVLEINVAPLVTVLLSDLDLDLQNWERVESSHPENLFYYTNVEHGVTVETKYSDGCERVISIKYGPSRRDLGLACHLPRTTTKGSSTLLSYIAETKASCR
jgi:hypothetical protein